MRMMALRPSSSEGNWRKHVDSIGDIFTLVISHIPKRMIEHATESRAIWIPGLGQSCLGGVGVVFGGGGMACSRRSDMKMPAMATAQIAREMLRRVLGGRTRIAA